MLTALTLALFRKAGKGTCERVFKFVAMKRRRRSLR